MTPDSDYKELLASVAEVRAPDPMTIEIVTNGPNPTMPSNLTNLFIMDKEWAEANNAVKVQDYEGGEDTFAAKNANGTGPYKLVSREPDVKTVLAAYDGYWGKGEFPLEVTEVIYTPIQNAATRVAALLSGGRGQEPLCRRPCAPRDEHGHQPRCHQTDRDARPEPTCGHDRPALCERLVRGNGQFFQDRRGRGQGPAGGSGLWRRVLHSAGLPERPLLYMLGWGVPTYDSEYIFNFLVHGKSEKYGSWNGTRFNDDALNAKIVSLSSNTDLDARNADIKAIWEVVQDQALYIPIHHQVLNWGMKTNVDTLVEAEDSPKIKYFKMK